MALKRSAGGQRREPRSRPLEMRGAHALIYITPCLLLVAGVYGYALVKLMIVSLQRVGIGNIADRFIGFGNFQFILSDPMFHQSIQHNLTLFAAIPVMLLLAIIAAYVLNDEFYGWRFFRSLIFLPYILSITVVGIIFSRVFTLDGLLNRFLESIGLDILTQDWLGQGDLALWSVIAVIVWKETGLGVLLLYSAMLNVPEDHMDAARLDGAGWWRRLGHVVLPHISRHVELYLIFVAITLLSWIFAYVFVMTQGGPGVTTFVIELYIYMQTFRYGQMGVGAAVSLGLLCGAILLATALLVLRRLGRARWAQ